MSVTFKSKKKTAFKRLFALGDERIASINSMMMQNENSLDIAKVIQKDWGKYKGVSEASLAKQLSRYKSTELLTAPSNQLDPISTEEKMAILEGLGERVDAVSGMNELVNLQRNRIMATVTREEKYIMPLSWLSKDILALSSLLKDLLEMEFDTGLRRRVPKTGGLHLVPHENSESYEKYVNNRTSFQEVSDATMDLLRIVEAEYHVIDNHNGSGAGQRRVSNS